MSRYYVMSEEFDQFLAPLDVEDIAVFVVVANVASADPSVACDGVGSSLI